MYDTTIAAKLLSQLESFLGRISPHFHKPTVRFIGDMIYGIMVEKDILKRGRRWRGFDSKEEGKEDGPSLFDFFGLNTG